MATRSEGIFPEGEAITSSDTHRREEAESLGHLAQQDETRLPVERFEASKEALEKAKLKEAEQQLEVLNQMPSAVDEKVRLGEELARSFFLRR